MKHLVIAGTGRAGTTFLVEWLGACGLDVGEWKPGQYFPKVRAGYERRLTSSNLPYVVKDPWLHTYLDEIDPDIIDVLVVPVRHLDDVAASRIRNRRGAGGITHSLNHAAERNYLAVGFHRLIEWAARQDVPTVLLSYPRIVADDWYAIDKLDPWLPHWAKAREAHREVAKP